MSIQVKMSLRKRKRDLKNALGDDILRYIAELVTNSDDSYKRLGTVNSDKTIVIELQKDKRIENGYMISVTDNAEGMSKQSLEKIFSTYGEDNAKGLSSHARGIFGQGASDVLQAAAKEKRTAKIESIKDGVLSKLIYNMDDELNASIDTSETILSSNQLQQLRKNLRINENGTKISFGIPSTVKQTKKIIDNIEDMMNKYYSFRYLLNQNDLKVIFKKNGKETVLSSKQYQFKDDNLLTNDDFSFKFENNEISCNLKLYKNKNKIDDSTNIIVRDENYVIYDNTMFDFQNNAASQDISGELIINGLYQICYNHLNNDDPDAIVSDNRTGFDTKNQFYILLNKAINPFIENVMKANGRDIKTTNLNNNKNFSDALKKLNKYLKTELKDTIGPGNLVGKEPPSEGIKFVRNNISITKDKQYDLKLLINSNMIKVNESITISCDDNNINFSPDKITYSSEEINNGLVIKNVTIKGLELTKDSSILIAECNSRKATVAIDVIPLDIHYPENGMEFYPNDVTSTENKFHFLKLYVDSDIIPLGSNIILECNDLECATSIIFDKKSLLDDKIGVINIALNGGKLDNTYILKANYNDFKAEAKITIVEETKNEPQSGGMIAGFKLEPSDYFFQSYFNPTTHYIVINNRNPINMRIMGEMNDKDAESPKFNKQQSQYLCDIISNQAATLLVKQKNIKNGEVNFDDFENAVEQVQSLIQQQKNKIYSEIYPAIIGMAEEKED